MLDVRLCACKAYAVGGIKPECFHNEMSFCGGFSDLLFVFIIPTSSVISRWRMSLSAFIFLGGGVLILPGTLPLHL
jgi:hypothetical protein